MLHGASIYTKLKQISQAISKNTRRIMEAAFIGNIKAENENLNSPLDDFKATNILNLGPTENNDQDCSNSPKSFIYDSTSSNSVYHEISELCKIPIMSVNALEALPKPPQSNSNKLSDSNSSDVENASNKNDLFSISKKPFKLLRKKKQNGLRYKVKNILKKYKSIVRRKYTKISITHSEKPIKNELEVLEDKIIYQEVLEDKYPHQEVLELEDKKPILTDIYHPLNDELNPNKSLIKLKNKNDSISEQLKTPEKPTSSNDTPSSTIRRSNRKKCPLLEFWTNEAKPIDFSLKSKKIQQKTSTRKEKHIDTIKNKKRRKSDEKSEEILNKKVKTCTDIDNEGQVCENTRDLNFITNTSDSDISNYREQWLENFAKALKPMENKRLKIHELIVNKIIRYMNCKNMKTVKGNGIQFSFHEGSLNNFGFIKLFAKIQKPLVKLKKYDLNYILLSGQLEFSREFNIMELKEPGDNISIMRNMRYRIRNLANEPALVFFTKFILNK